MQTSLPCKRLLLLLFNPPPARDVAVSTQKQFLVVHFLPLRRLFFLPLDLACGCRGRKTPFSMKGKLKSSDAWIGGSPFLVAQINKSSSHSSTPPLRLIFWQYSNHI